MMMRASRKIGNACLRRSAKSLGSVSLCGVSCNAPSLQRRFASSSTMGSQFDAATGGNGMVTPSFGDMSHLGEAPDLGKVETKPASNFSTKDAQGPWILLAAGELQGELFVEDNGMVMFRPGGMLGQGIGTIEFQETSIGATTFRIELECYLYRNVAEHPPHAPTRYEITGIVATASASKKNYKTFTLAGQVHKLASDSQAMEQVHAAGENLGSMNAAKMSPWDKSTVKHWAPNEEVREAFRQVFNAPLNVLSHKTRAQAARKEVEAAMGKKTDLSIPVHPNLEQFRVGDLDTVYYIPNYISEEEEQQMLTHLHATPKEMKNQLSKRLVQEWGCSMCTECNKSFIADCTLPPYTEKLNEMLLHDGIFEPSIFPNNVRIHEYNVGEGIAPHVDGPIYVPRVAIVSLASPVVMHFYPRTEPHDEPMEHYNDTFKFDGTIAQQKPVMSCVLEPRSCIVFQDTVYSHHPHGISDKAVDSLAPEVCGVVANRHLLSPELKDVDEIVRSYRVGVTIRNLLPRCNHQVERTEYCMRHAWNSYHQLPPSKQIPLQPSLSEPSPSSLNASPVATEEMRPPSPPGTLSPKQSTQSPSSSGMASSPSSADLKSIEARLDNIAKTQQELMQSIEELKTVVVHTTSATASFQKEMSGVMNHMTSTVLELQSTTDDILDKLEESKE